MKNNILYIFFGLLLLGSFSSCEEQLELFPQDAIAVDLAYQNEGNFSDAIKGVYSAFRRSGYYGATSGAASIYYIPDVMSDNVIINSNGRRSREAYYDWRHSEDSSSETFWLSAYKVIQRSNLILENIGVLSDGDFKNNIKGEALAARGIAHFDLVKFYGSSPAQTSDGLGVPFVTSSESDLRPERNSLSETYTLLMADLTEAHSLINEDNGAGRLNKNAVAALLSRVHLFRGDDAKVIEFANLVTGVDEVDRDNVFNLWKDEVETSVLWKVRIDDPDNINIGVAWLQESPDGIRSEYNVDYELYQMYDDSDIRKEVYFETSDFSGITYNHIVKFRGRLTGDANVVDAKAIRFSEVLLNKAEALANTGSDGDALAALDMLRSNRYSGFASGGETGQALKDAIQKERRLELAFEGDRFFTLKRRGMGINRSSFGDLSDGTGIGAEFLTLPANDSKFNMAIGSGEIEANPNMQQNPGY